MVSALPEHPSSRELAPISCAAEPVKSVEAIPDASQLARLLMSFA